MKLIEFKNTEHAKSLALNMMASLIATVVLLYGTYNFLIGRNLLAWVDLIVGLSLIILVTLRIWLELQIRNYVFVGLLYLFLNFLLVNGGTGNVSYIWLMIFPPIIFYLLGSAIGRWLVVLEFLIILILTGLDAADLISLPYSSIVVFQITASFLLITILTYIAERDREFRNEHLVDLKRQMDLVLRHSPLILFRLDKNGVFTMSQGKGLDSLGLKPDQVVGTSVFDAYKDYPAIVEAVKKALLGDSTHHRIKINGAELMAYYSPFFNDTGEVAGVVGMGIDQSEEYQSRKELSARLTELAELNQLMVGREIKMAELKEKIARLEKK